MTAVSRLGLLVGGLASLVAAAGLLWWRHTLRDDWQSEMRAGDCSPVRDLPDVGLQVWGAVALSLVALLLFGVHAWASRRRTPKRSAVTGSVLACGALLLLLGSLLLATTTPTDANDGLDGSGLPCPSSM